jgi:hypothetical protein
MGVTNVIDTQTTVGPANAKARARWGVEREARAYATWMRGVVAQRTAPLPRIVRPAAILKTDA